MIHPADTRSQDRSGRTLWSKLKTLVRNKNLNVLARSLQSEEPQLFDHIRPLHSNPDLFIHSPDAHVRKYENRHHMSTNGASTFDRELESESDRMLTRKGSPSSISSTAMYIVPPQIPPIQSQIPRTRRDPNIQSSIQSIHPPDFQNQCIPTLIVGPATESPTSSIFSMLSDHGSEAWSTLDMCEPHAGKSYNATNYSLFAPWLPHSSSRRSSFSDIDSSVVLVRSTVPGELANAQLEHDITPSPTPMLENADKLQDWLDDNLDHPDRQSRVKWLLDIFQRDGQLPKSLFIGGVQWNHDEYPAARGNFAEVYQGTYGTEEVAVKCLQVPKLPMNGVVKDKFYKRFCREALIWRQLRHPRILPFLGVDREAFRSRGLLVIASPWITHGTLMQYLLKSSNEPISHKRLITDVTSGLRYLHAYTFAHGDLHGSNVYVNRYNRAVLGDFGLTAITDVEHLAPDTVTSINKAGACRWLSPELFHREEGPPPSKTMEGDIFALGRICLAIFTRHVPFYRTSQDVGVIFRVCQHEYPPRPDHDECHGKILPNDLWGLICQCWNGDPKKRPNIVSLDSQLRSLIF